MNPEKKKKLEARGWKVGDAADFLGLSPDEVAYLEIKEALGRCVREHRRSGDRTQALLAEELGSSQSRVAKMEAGDASVSLDLLIRSLLTMGVSREEIAQVIGSSGPDPSTRSSARRARRSDSSRSLAGSRA